MQILAIRGHDLASLSEKFEIDLQQEPLRSAGLFAITGETGAGKSTILDAMCLALYGDCPRLSSAGINDDVPDVSGETIKARDSRGILRRGSASGEAQVDFIAEDGQSYRATWGARRARGRPDGRLQKPERSLIRLSDGQVLESQINAVNARVVQLTGLSFEQFKRSALLAQGDFDAFLRADTADRASLLEKVTGTGVYREISKRIYAREAEAREALERLQARHGEHAALSDEDRGLLRGESDSLNKEIAESGEALKSLTADLQIYKETEAAEARLAQARGASAAAEAEHKASAGDRALMQRLDTALPIRPAFDRAHEAKSAAGRAEAALTATEAALQASANDTSAARKASDEAAAKSAEIEADFKALGPEWSQAAQLDSQIQSAAGEVRTAEAALKDAGQHLEEAVQAEAVLAASKADQNAALLAASENLEKAAGIGNLAASWPAVHARIQERGALRQEQKQAALSQTAAVREGNTARDGITRVTAADNADRARIAEIDSDTRKASLRLKEIEADDQEARLMRVTDARSALNDLIAQARAADDAGRKSSHFQAAAKEAADGLAAAEADFKEAETSIAASQSAIDALTAPTERAEAAASQAAAKLRLHLEDGAPCPVCGSCDHPVPDDDPLAGIAAEMRETLNGHRTLLQSATRTRDEAQSRIATCTARKEQSEKDGEQYAAAHADACESYSDIRQRGALSSILSMIPETAAGACEALSAVASKLDIRRTEITGLIEEARHLRASSDQRSNERNRLQAAIEDRRKRLEDLRATASQADQARALAQQSAEAAEKRVGEIDAELSPALAPAQVSLGDLDKDAAAPISKLKRAVDWWNEQTRAAEAARAALADLAPRIAAASSDVQAARLSLGKASKASEERRRIHSALEEERSGLLGGEPTDTHRTRWNDSRLQAAEAKDKTARILSDAAERQAAALQRKQTAQETLAECRSAVEGAKASLSAEIESSGLDPEDLPILMGMKPEQAASLRQKLREIDDRITSTASALKERQGDLEALHEAGLPALSKEDVAAAVEAAEAEQTRRRERIGVIAGQLAADDQARARLAGLQHEIDAQRAECDTWAPVNAAVGSSSGNKFTRIAQAVTLSVLVERANTHLEMLKPRYQLAQGGEDLALHVIDHDMGGEIRSTRSLSGGECFLISLSLALALSGLGRQGAIAATLFIDEGFGTLDAETLDIAIEALETLQSQGRTIGVISHVEAMKDRIPVQVMVRRKGAGTSSVEVGLAA